MDAKKEALEKIIQLTNNALANQQISSEKNNVLLLEGMLVWEDK